MHTRIQIINDNGKHLYQVANNVADIVNEILEEGGWQILASETLTWTDQDHRQWYAITVTLG